MVWILGKSIQIIANAVPPRSLLSKPRICMSHKGEYAWPDSNASPGTNEQCPIISEKNTGFLFEIVSHPAHAVKRGIIHPSFMCDCPVYIEKPMHKLQVACYLHQITYQSIAIDVPWNHPLGKKKEIANRPTLNSVPLETRIETTGTVLYVLRRSNSD